MLRKKKPAFNTIGQPFGKSGSPKAGGDFIFSVVKGALEEVHPGFTDPYDPEAVSQDLTAFLLKKVDGRDRHLLETWQSVAAELRLPVHAFNDPSEPEGYYTGGGATIAYRGEVFPSTLSQMPVGIRVNLAYPESKQCGAMVYLIMHHLMRIWNVPRKRR